MSAYDRITRVCPVSQLRPELLQAVHSYFEEHQLGDLETETLACYETVSRKKDPGRLVSWMNDGLDQVLYTGMILTSQRLIWVRSGSQSKPTVTAADLREIQVKVYASWLAKDTGLEIGGFIGEQKIRTRGYVGMESVTIAQAFYEQVWDAIDKVRPPVKRKRPWWLGG